MSGLFTYVRQLILVVFMTQVASLLAPSGEIKPYVKFVCGLLIVLAVISPLSEPGWLKMGAAPGGFELWSTGDMSEAQFFIEDGETVRQKAVSRVYLERLGRFIASELNGLPALRESVYRVRVHAEAPEIKKEEISADELLHRVTVVLMVDDQVREEDNLEKTGVGEVVTVAPVEPVTVGENSWPRGADNEPKGEEDGIPQTVRASILRHLQHKYGLMADRVQVVGEGTR